MRNIPTKIDGTSTLSAAEFNDLADEIEGVITRAGISLSSADVSQLTKAISYHVAGDDYYADGGSATTYVLTPIGTRLMPPALFTGMRVRFKPTNSNTSGACTVNVGGLGVKNIKMYDGSDPDVSDLLAGMDVEMVYDGTKFVVTALASTAAGGASVATASQAEMEAASSTTAYVTPGRTKFHPGVVKAWAQVSISGGVATLTASSGFASATYVTTGIVDLVPTTAFSSVNYSVVTSSGPNSSGSTVIVLSKAEATMRMIAYSGANNQYDLLYYHVAVLGDQ